MNSALDNTDFVDTDYQTSRGGAQPPAPAGAAAFATRPPSRDELDSKVTEAHQKLADLRQQQETLERERATLEEARRRQSEFHTGREELVTALNRGIGLIEQTEFNARRDAEAAAKELTDLRDHLAKVQSLNQDSWTQENYNAELTRALTTLENARMEWNGARLKFPALDGATVAAATSNGPAPVKDVASLLAAENFGQLCRIGFALTWPLLLVGFAITGLLLFRH
ncbi:MAG: hypothetical protein HY301_10305 [Verrucomicrobia bacterium]|nr:hypothetical protein [Verrucomicrobiota bacterium]